MRSSSRASRVGGGSWAWITARGAQLRRVLPRGLRGLVGDGPILDWTDMEPFVGHVPSSRLRFSHRKLANLHPAEIADLVEAASHDEGEELIEAVAQDRELEADVFEELDEHHQLEFIRERPDTQAAAVVARMAADDAADLIVEIDQDRRGRILALLPPAQRRQIESLLGYNPSTAGGLMSPDFISLEPTDTVEAALAKVRASKLGAGTLTTVYLLDDEGGLVGSAFVVALLRAEELSALQEIAEHEPVSVATGRGSSGGGADDDRLQPRDAPGPGRERADGRCGDGRRRARADASSGWRRRFGLVRD